jgi:NAD(P)-dependent dehydrogenase (short-subunit alcohol dehydrogenase family)
MPQAIVTGGAIRVGKAIALALAKEGFDIILTFNNSMEQAQSVAEEIKKIGKNCWLYRYDLSKVENCDALFADISKKHDNISLLVNNAAIFERASFMETNEKNLDDHFNINFKAPFFLTQNFARYIQTRPYIEQANVINILDAQISKNNTGFFAYYLTKKALHDFTNMAARELAPKVRVNAVSIGLLLPSIDIDAEGLKQKATELPLKKITELRDVIDAILYLNKSNYLTGQNIFLDSGASLV